MPSDLTLDTIIEEVNTALGKSGVNIELADDDFEKALKDTIRVYNRNRPRRGKASLPVGNSQKKYGPLNTGATRPAGFPNAGAVFLGVVEVNFVPVASPILDPFDTTARNISGTLSGNNASTFGEVVQQMQYVKMATEVASAEPEWSPYWDGTNFYLFVDVVRSNWQCSYTYTYGVTADDDGLKLIDQGDEDWILGFVTARVKQILGRIRGKFGGIPGSDGGNDEIDADKLLEEAKEEEEKLTEEIKKRRRPLPPVVG